MAKIEVNRVVDKMTQQTEAQMIKEYRNALKDIKNTLAEIYEKYARTGDISYADMQKYNRLEKLQQTINRQLTELTKNTTKLIKTNSSNAFQTGYYMNAFEIYKVKASLSFSIVDKKVIQASVENPISGLTLTETLNKNRADVIMSIKRQITQGLLKGESYGKMADRVAEILNRDITKAIRVVRTEAHRNQNQGHLHAVEEADKKGVKMKKIWYATLDNRTRDSHRLMDGQTVNVGEDFVSMETGARGPAPGMLGEASEDINCRCIMGEIVEDIEPAEKRITYKEWLEGVQK